MGWIEWLLIGREFVRTFMQHPFLGGLFVVAFFGGFLETVKFGEIYG